MGFIAQMITSLSMQGLSTYIGPLESTFGWSTTQTAAGRSFQQADSFLGPMSGWLVDRFGPRRLMSLGVILYVISFALFSQITSLWAYYAVCLLMGLSNSLLGLLVVSYSINQWFRRKRATAMGLAVTGFAVSGALFIPMIVWAQSEYGWRFAAFATGIGILLIGWPTFLFMRDRPERYGLLPDGDRSDAAAAGTAHARGGGLVDFTFREALRTRALWLITAAMTLAMLSQSAVIVHQFPHLETQLTRETAALILAELNIFNLAGRILGGMLGDRTAKHRLLGINLAVTSAALVLLAMAATWSLLLVYGALFGFSWGLRTAVANSLYGDYFGRPAFGRIVGFTQTFAAPAAIVAPIVVGAAVDSVGGYELSFLALAAITALSALLFFLATRPPDPRVSRPG